MAQQTLRETIEEMTRVQVLAEDCPVVQLDYQQVIDTQLDLTQHIRDAYGPQGLGILVVRGVPGLPEIRQRLLTLIREFGMLDPQIQAQYEHQESMYNFGWSHGKESMSKGVPDLAKGSYYFNPLEEDKDDIDPELAKQHPTFFTRNIWPSEHVPGLQKAAEDAAELVVNTGRLLMIHCDRYVASEVPSYQENLMSNILKASRFAKARMLHYFPIEDEGKEVQWCGWHCDHGTLTGLIPAMFFNADGTELDREARKNLGDNGLFIRSRNGQDTRVFGLLPNDLAFQIGETAQVQSGGALQSTPHYVKGGRLVGISRETMAIFMEPEYDQIMDLPADISLEEFDQMSSSQDIPEGVPRLLSRWRPNMTFGEFSQVTIDAYYS